MCDASSTVLLPMMGGDCVVEEPRGKNEPRSVEASLSMLGQPPEAQEECRRCCPRCHREDPQKDSLELARIATLVATGWLLVLLCCYWQYRILQPYAQSLLWAAICSTALRKTGPILEELKGRVCSPIAEAFQTDERRMSVWVRSSVLFVAQPFRAFCRNGPYSSRLFFSMLGRGWLMWALWWVLTRQLLAAIMIGIAIASVMLFIWIARRVVQYAYRVSDVFRSNASGCRVRRSRSFSGVSDQIQTHSVLGIAMLGITVVFFAIACQLHFEVLFISRAVAAHMPSSTLELIRDERGDLALPEFVMQRIAKVNVSSPDVCGALRARLALDEDAGAAFLSVCTMAQERLVVYLQAPLHNMTECSEALPDDDSPSMDIVCNASSGGGDIAVQTHEPPFHVLTRKLHESAKETLRGFLPETASLADKAFRHFQLLGASDEAQPTTSPTYQDLHAAMDELKSVIRNVTETLRASAAVEVVPEVSSFFMNTFWSCASQALFATYFVITKAFNAALQMIVFGGAMLHLSSAEWGLLEYLRVLMVSVGQAKGEKMYRDLDHAIGAALGAPLKLAFFHTSFTCLLLVCFGSPVVCIPAAFAGVCAIISPPWAHVVTLCQGFNLWSSDAYWSAAFVWSMTALVWWFVPDSIYSDIANPFLTGLSIVMGAACMGPIGCILGPILIVVPIEVLQNLTGDEVHFSSDAPLSD